MEKNDKKNENLDPEPIGVDNADIIFIMNDRTEEVTEEYQRRLQNLLEKCELYKWSAQKRTAAEEASWKELIKRMTLLSTEGLDVNAGSVESKELRKQNRSKQSYPHLASSNKKRDNKKKSQYNKERNSSGSAHSPRPNPHSGAASNRPLR